MSLGLKGLIMKNKDWLQNKIAILIVTWAKDYICKGLYREREAGWGHDRPGWRVRQEMGA